MLHALNRLRRTRAIVAAIALASTEACYSYVPLALAAPKVGERVSVALTPQGVTEMARFLGPNVSVAEGTLSSIDSEGAMVVAVDYVQTMNGVRQPWSGEGTVSIPHGYVTEVRQRTFQRGQSITAFTALGAALFTIAVLALRSGGAKGGGDSGGQPPP